jgi:hypothetical protein
MKLKAKKYEETRKAVDQDKLTTRVAALEAKGVDKTGIEKDVLVKKLKADLRKTKRRLTAVAAQEKLQAQKQETKAQKEAAKKEAEAPVKAAKPKKEEAKPQKKEKKAKEKNPTPAAE